jgi:hypothetical protein
MNLNIHEKMLIALKEEKRLATDKKIYFYFFKAPNLLKWLKTLGDSRRESQILSRGFSAP